MPNQPGWEQCDFYYQAEDWSYARPCIAVRQEKAPEEKTGQRWIQYELFGPQPQYDYFCYVITEPLNPWEGHCRYGERATAETWIEEAKNQMGLAHLKTSDFLANSALFQCAILAYNIIRWMALLSGNARLQRWEPATIRGILIRVVGKLLTGGRQLRLRVPCDHAYQQEWDAWLALDSPP